MSLSLFTIRGHQVFTVKEYLVIPFKGISEPISSTLFFLSLDFPLSLSFSLSSSLLFSYSPLLPLLSLSSLFSTLLSVYFLSPPLFISVSSFSLQYEVEETINLSLSHVLSLSIFLLSPNLIYTNDTYSII